MRGPTSVSPDGLPPCSRGMTATGSHVHFYSLHGAQPQGEGFSQSRQAQRRFLLLNHCYLAGGACRRPYTQNRQPLPPLIRHGLRPVPPSPRGRLISEGSAPFYNVQAYTPSGTFGATSPYTPGGKRLAVSAYGIRTGGACRRPYSQKRQPYRPSSVCPAGSRLPTKPAQGRFALGG